MRGVFVLAQLIRNQWRSSAELERSQFAELKRLVTHAYEAVPFYRQLYDQHGVRPTDLKAPDDLQRFPIVTREQIQSTPDHQLVATGVDPGRCLRSRTSGSTGVPLEILFRPGDRRAMNTSFLRVYLAWGLRPWHRTVTLQARPERLDRRSWYQRLGIFRTEVLFSRDDPDSWIEVLRSRRPWLLHGYSLTLKLLAEALGATGVHDLRVPLVTSTSGILDDAARHQLAGSLEAEVVDIYASDEAGSVIAWECPRCDGYHLCSDTVVTELVRDGRPARPGEDGSVVITNLTGRTMPFIRYDQGDVARATDRRPVCGRGLPLMDGVRGRAGDFIVLRSGRKLTPHPFFLVLDHALGVGRWRIVQETVDHIRVSVTMTRGHDRPDLDAIRTEVGKLVDPGTTIEVHVVDSVRDEGRSKLRSVMSKLTEGQTPDASGSSAPPRAAKPGA